MNLSRVACKYFDINLSATLPNGQPVVPGGVDIAIVRAGESPDEETQWHPAQYADGVATIMLAGPDATAPPESAIVIPEPGGDLHARVVDVPETDAAMLTRIVLV